MAARGHEGELSVLFVTRKWAPAIGGMETYALRLSEELGKLASVDVVALPGRANGQPPSPARLLSFPLVVAWRWFARKRKPDILHIADMAIWPLALLARISGGATRPVLSAHGTDVSYHRRAGLKGRVYRAYLKIGARLLGDAQVIANSRATRAVTAETGWPAASVVKLATDAASAPGDARHHNGRLLFAGRMIALKGCGWFIREVLPLLPDDIGLDIAGTVWSEEERRALDHARVRHIGALDKARLARAYREAMCVIVPNIPLKTGEYEGFGLVAPEAAAAGGVVLAARCDGLVDAVIDGTTGILVRPQDAQAWSQAIREVAGWTSEQREQFIARSQACAASEYSWARVSRQTLSAYRQALHR